MKVDSKSQCTPAIKSLSPKQRHKVAVFGLLLLAGAILIVCMLYVSSVWETVGEALQKVDISNLIPKPGGQYDAEKRESDWGTLIEVGFALAILAIGTLGLLLFIEAMFHKETPLLLWACQRSELYKQSKLRWYHFAVAIALPVIGLPWATVDIMREKWKTGAVMFLLSVLSFALIVVILLKVRGL